MPITLTTHIDDVINEMVWHDLTNVVLVVHSYGGFVGTGVVERAGDRVASLVYLDAFIPEDGQSFEDIWGEKLTGVTVATPEVLAADYPSETQRAMVAAKSTPQPTGTFTERLAVSGAYRSVARKMFIVASGWDSPLGAVAAPLRDDPAWSVHDLPSGHDVPLLMPDALTALLETAVPD